MFRKIGGTFCHAKHARCGELLEMPVLLSVIAVSLAGLFIGLRFKAPALMAATALLLAASFAWNVLDLPGHVTITRFLILAFVLALAYIVGVSFSGKLRRENI